MKRIITLVFFCAIFQYSSAQMWNGVDTLYGNEWIDFDQSYYKIMVANDGIYRVSQQSLVDQGIPVGSINGNEFELYRLGESQPIYVTTQGTFGTDDYIEFYGVRNRSELDEYLFQNPELEMANTEYSLFTDSTAYFLTWSSSPNANNIQNISNDLSNAPSSAEPFCLYEMAEIFSDHHAEKRFPNFVYYSSFGMTEGFVGPANAINIVNIEAEQPYLSGPTAKLNTRSISNNFTDLNPNHSHTISVNGSLLAQDDFVNAKVIAKELDVQSSGLGNPIEVKFESIFNNNDKQKVAFVKLKYPRTFDFSGKNSIEFSMPSSNGYQLLEITNFDITGDNPILYDVTNGTRLETTVSGSTIQVALPASSEERKMILVNPVAGINNVDVKAVDFIDYTQVDANYIILSNSSLYDDPVTGLNWVQEYADYRGSTAGRSFDVVNVDVQQLYDQFGYGINRHHISIRNFGHFVNKEWTNPEHMFILGKGRVYSEIRKESEIQEAIANNTFHVPTFGGGNGSDNLLLSTNVTEYPIFSIGRLAAKTPKDIQIYLDKVVIQESNQNGPQTIESKEWRKRVLHLGGGNTQEQPRFRGYLEQFESKIIGNKFGGEVTSFFKTSSDPIQISLSDQITELIDDGVSLITTFGHASINGFDFSIDNPSSYNNEGRYPVFISLGCYSGQIHSGLEGISEQFILEEKKGAIVFFASTGISFEPSLKIYGNEFYRQLADKSYGLTIGEIARQTAQETNTSIGYLAGIITLHGDPALVVSLGQGPDYVVDSETVTFSPNPISIQLDTFEMSFDVVNIGARVGEKMLVEVIQELPDGTQHNIIVDSIDAPSYRKTLKYRVPPLGNDALGANKFLIEIDKGNAIVELPDPVAEQNNRLVNDAGVEGVVVHFISNEVVPIFPRDFGIVGEQNVTLKASTSSPFLEEQKYVFQIDTTEFFDSPFLKTFEVDQKGGVLRWTPNISYQNEEVYYWRVSPEENPDVGGFIWRNHSFVFLNGESDGWNQSHFYQYQKDQYTNIELLDNREFEFIKDFKDFKVTNRVVEPPYIERCRVFINSSRWAQYSGYPDAFVGVLVMDSVEIVPWFNFPNNPYGATFVANNTRALFAFRTNNVLQRENLIDFLTNDVPTGSYVLVWTLHEKGFSYKPEDWADDVTTLGTSIFDLLEAEGATQVRELEDTGPKPYIFAYKKGGGAIEEVMAANEDEVLESTFAIAGNWNSGSFESTTIGPASNWNSLQWQTSGTDNPSDNFSVSVYGIDANGQDSLLHENIMAFDTTLNHINAEEFPYLKLRYYAQDTIQKTPAQLDFWRVLYDGIPEVAINSANHFVVSNDSLTQGEKFRVEVGLENVSIYPTDSLLVSYTIKDLANNETNFLKRYRPMAVGDTIIASFETETINFSNVNTFEIFANPAFDQPEETLVNNVGFFDFFIETDKRNPLLDVTFDGVHIMDGDLVSSRPSILITLKDENQFLALDDPELVKIYLKSPNEPEVRQIFVDGDTLTFIPGDINSGNKSQLLFQPHLLDDGNYFLIVQAQDKSGNQSGALDYKITFEVINKSSITNVLNYPNPFSTSTQFVFTLTGDEIPEDMKIQIYTISGRIVREIRQEELGPIHVGNNLTDAWDGTDEFGQRLANGVYLYRVVSRRSNDESFEHRNTNADRFFKNGFGKLVIIR